MEKINLTVLKSFVGEDQKTLDGILSIMCSQFNEFIKGLNNAILQKDAPTIIFILHKLLSSLGYLGCDELVKKVKDLERAVKLNGYNLKTKQDVENILSSVYEIEKELRDLTSQ